MARSLLPIDEINSFRERLYVSHVIGRLRTEEGKAECIDELLDLLIMSYALGNEAVNEMLDADVPASVEEMERVIYREVDGKTFVDRVNEYADAETAVEDIARVAETESHHAYDASADDTAVKAGATRKKWHTMKDDRVRDTHSYLEGVEVGMGDHFYTYTGAHAPFPGLFNDAREDCNCRCWVEYTR